LTWFNRKWSLVAELESGAAMSDAEMGHASLALLYTLPEGRPVWGVASLGGDELFVIRERASDVEVQ